MTCKGTLTSINRQGIKRGDVGPLAKASFENTTDQLIKAGIFSEKDTLKGVSSNIMMGQRIKSGTGMCEVYLDEDSFWLLLSDQLSLVFTSQIEEESTHNQPAPCCDR